MTTKRYRVVIQVAEFVDALDTTRAAPAFRCWHEAAAWAEHDYEAVRAVLKRDFGWNGAEDNASGLLDEVER